MSFHLHLVRRNRITDNYTDTNHLILQVTSRDPPLVLISDSSHCSFFPVIRSNSGFVGDLEARSSDTSGDLRSDDADNKIIPEQILLSDLRRPGHTLQDTNTNICQHNNSFIWCLPNDYNQEKHPFTCRILYQSYLFFLQTNVFLDFHLVNKSLPWDYAFRFVIEEISNINDKAQTMSISMYFAVSWFEPRLKINKSASEWTEDRTGPLNVNTTKKHF